MPGSFWKWLYLGQRIDTMVKIFNIFIKASHDYHE